MLKALFVVAYICAPLLLLRVHRFWGVPAAVLALWIPVEAGLLVRLGIRPLAVAAIAVGAGLLAFRSRPDVLDLRAAFNVFNIETRMAALNFLIFAAIAIPLGLTLGFIRPAFDASEISGIPSMAAFIFLSNALPEEILFRGLIQNWIEKRTRLRTGSLAIASLIFGASHLNNGPTVPNYDYMLMASIAGVFYGLAWRSRKNVLTSSITHTLVNTGWNVFFR
jgi:membrane protease YdiL (CAAX protease family)